MSATLDVRRLLTIDVDAEIRKLGRAPLGSVDEVPALLAARAIRAGARDVAVRLDSGRIEIRDDAGDLDGFRLADLAVLLSPERSPRQRHGALVSLETAGATALLALASLGEITALRIAGGRGGTALAWRRGTPPSLSEDAPRARTRIEVEGLRVSRSAARRLLAETCRFATASVSLDGEPLPRGFREILGETRLEEPLRGRLAIPSRAENGAHVWLTVHGAVMAHTSLPGLVGFVAAVELGQLDLPADAAALREAVEPLTGPLERQALDLLVRLARRPGADPTALRDHVLRAARRRPDVPALRRLPCLPCAGEAEPPRRLSLAELEGRARDGSVVALFPDQDPRDFRTPPGHAILVLDAAERSLLDRLTGVRFVTPPRRWRPTRFQRWLGAVRRVPGALAARLARARPVHPLPDHLWSPQERALVCAVRIALRQRGSPAPALVAAGICRGGGRPRPRGDTLWLPRGSRDVRRAARALERRGPGFARVAATAVLPPA